MCKHIERNHDKYLKSDQRVENKEGIENYFPVVHDMEPDILINQVKYSFEMWKQLITYLLESKQSSFDMHSVYHVVEHCGYHLGQIVDRVQRISGQPFQFCQRGINEKNLKDIIDRRYPGGKDD
ncbi:hypothetical protein [Cohnella kolymensis]|uniref:hypothetical protein n=1 Tax=Cohnella kolymensis TaxID=1590652 RepID=UPI000ABC4B96|nr:hypothetical protein [Cohnella kolymensis]